MDSFGLTGAGRAKRGPRLSVLFIEPYYGGSHRTFADNLGRRMPFDITLLTMPPRKWKWRMRGSAITAAERARALTRSGARFDLIIASSMLNVSEFLGLTRDCLSGVPVLLVMHENQFAYPNAKEDERDIHFALTNVTSCLAATRIAWNSLHNRDTFLDGLDDLLRKMPDERPEGVAEAILSRSMILPPPIDVAGPGADGHPPAEQDARTPLRILWNHRWEHDKGPEVFFDALTRLADKGLSFELAVLGERFEREPPCFQRARTRLDAHIVAWGYEESRERYLETVRGCHVVVSTANHEFFGLSVVEAAAAGCRPLLPDRLSYPELFPAEYLYKDDEELVTRLEEMIAAKSDGRHGRLEALFSGASSREIAGRYSWDELGPVWNKLVEEAAGQQPLTS